MKKKYLKNIVIPKTIRGAYDKNNTWWCEEDIQNYTGGMIKMFFGKTREQIEIVERIIK